MRMIPDEERKAFVELTHNAIERSTVLATDIHARLADGRVVIIDGARHAAHHTHPAEVVAAVTSFVQDSPHA